MLRGVRPSQRRDERGAVVVMVAVMMALLLVVAAFAVDLGMQRVVRRDMQALADVVSLDLVRELDGRKKSEYSRAELDDALDESLARNADVLGDIDDVTYDLGELDDAGRFVTVGADGTPTAVEVVAGASVDYAFAPGSGSAARTAVATATESACFRVGSFIASLDTKESALLNPLLSALFGSAINLDAASYQGLARSNVSLLDLVNVGGLGVGTVDELLTLPGVRVADLFLASARVLDRQGQAVQANVLRTLAATVGTPTIAIADLIQAEPSDQAALNAALNVLDLVTGTAQVVSGGRTVNVPNLGINLPGVARTTTTLTVVEPARTGCGSVGAEVETAQVRLDVTAHVDARSLSVLGSSVSLDATDIKLSIDLGKAVARLRGVTCNAAGPDSMTLALNSALVGAVTVTATTGVRATIGVPAGDLLTQVLGLLGLGSLLSPPSLVLNAPVAISARAPAGGFDKQLTLPLPGSYEVPVGSGSGPLLSVPSVSVTSATELKLRYRPLLSLTERERTVLATDALFTSVVNPILSTLTSTVLTPIITTLQNALVLPLADLLGLQLGGADVFAVREPSCGAPRLQE